MKKSIKISILIIFIILICYITYSVLNVARYSYSIDMKKNFKSCFWLFKDSIKHDIDTNFFVSCIRKTDAFYHYIYKKKYNITIWNFKDIKSIDLESIPINQNVNLDNIKFDSGEILNKRSSPEITVRFGSFFKQTIGVNLDKNSYIKKSFKSEKFKGFYGVVKKISLTDENFNHIILFDYNTQVYFILLLYKGQRGFYFIIIDSESSFDESLYSILNLE